MLLNQYAPFFNKNLYLHFCSNSVHQIPYFYLAPNLADSLINTYQSKDKYLLESSVDYNNAKQKINQKDVFLFLLKHDDIDFCPAFKLAFHHTWSHQQEEAMMREILIDEYHLEAEKTKYFLQITQKERLTTDENLF